MHENTAFGNHELQPLHKWFQVLNQSENFSAFFSGLAHIQWQEKYQVSGFNVDPDSALHTSGKQALQTAIHILCMYYPVYSSKHSLYYSVKYKYQHK